MSLLYCRPQCTGLPPCLLGPGVDHPTAMAWRNRILAEQLFWRACQIPRKHYTNFAATNFLRALRERRAAKKHNTHVLIALCNHGIKLAHNASAPRYVRTHSSCCRVERFPEQGGQSSFALAVTAAVASSVSHFVGRLLGPQPLEGLVHLGQNHQACHRNRTCFVTCTDPSQQHLSENCSV